MKLYVFDLDDTLIYTDSLNGSSYNYALKSMKLGEIGCCNRVTRETVFNKYPELSEDQKEKIIKLKQEYFLAHLSETIPNAKMLNMLKDQNPESCLLWTNANKDRAYSILDYHGIRSSFYDVLFSDKSEIIIDAIKICQLFDCRFDQLLFFENDVKVIEDLRNLNLAVVQCG